ncbi:MAG: helix-turn-helix transcriptional regulator [Bdellovibrionota bacterium]
MKKMKHKRYRSVEEFGRSLGLSDLDIEVIRQKTLIAEKLRRERLKQRITQAKLADLVGSRQPAIARMEAGSLSLVSMDFLVKVALALNVSISITGKSVAA